LGNLMLAALIAIGQAGFFSFVSEVWQAVLMMIALLGGGIASIVLVTAARRHLPVRP